VKEGGENEGGGRKGGENGCHKRGKTYVRQLHERGGGRAVVQCAADRRQHLVRALLDRERAVGSVRERRRGREQEGEETAITSKPLSIFNIAKAPVGAAGAATAAPPFPSTGAAAGAAAAAAAGGGGSAAAC
jgi:hypothetical protein